MIKTLELAIEALERLPAADQERMGRQLITHVEKLLNLRIEIDKGVRMLEVNAAAPLDVDKFLASQNDRHGRA